MTRELSEIESDVVDAMRAHVAHGHGKITIDIKPGSIRVQEGKGRLYDFPAGTNGNKREKQAHHIPR